jgi:hypothetical protein
MQGSLELLFSVAVYVSDNILGDATVVRICDFPLVLYRRNTCICFDEQQHADEALLRDCLEFSVSRNPF